MNFFPRTAAIISFVVVLPALPVTPMIVFPQRRRTARASFCKASVVDATPNRSTPAKPRNFAFENDGRRLFLESLLHELWPSNLGPLTAKNRSAGFNVRVSIE